MDETFLLTNIAPQVGDGFNRHCIIFVVYQSNNNLMGAISSRLGICGRLVSETYWFILRGIRIHYSSLPSQEAPRWQMAHRM